MAIPSSSDMEIKDYSNPTYSNGNLEASSDGTEWSVGTAGYVMADIDPCGYQTPYTTLVQPGYGQSGSDKVNADVVTPLYIYPMEKDYKLANFTSTTTNSKKIVTKDASTSFYTSFTNYNGSTKVASPAKESAATLNLGLIPDAGTSTWYQQTSYGGEISIAIAGNVATEAADLITFTGTYEKPNTISCPSGSLRTGINSSLSVTINNYPSDGVTPHAVLIKSVTFSYQPVAYIYAIDYPNGYQNLPLKFTDGSWYKTVTVPYTPLGTSGTDFSFAVCRVNSALEYNTSQTSVTGTLNVSLPVGDEAVTFSLTKGGGWQLYAGGTAVNIYLRIFNIQVSYQYAAEITYTTSQTNVTVNKQAITAFQLYPIEHQLIPWTVWRSGYTKLDRNYGTGYSLWKRTTDAAIITQAKASSNAAAIPAPVMWQPIYSSSGSAGETTQLIQPTYSSAYHASIPNNAPLTYISLYTPSSRGDVPYGVTSQSEYEKYVDDNVSNYLKMGYYQRWTDYDTISDEQEFMDNMIDTGLLYATSGAITCNLYPYINDSTKVWDNNSTYLVGTMKLPKIYYPYRYDLLQNKYDSSIWARGTIQVKYTVANGDSLVRAKLTTVRPSSSTLISDWSPNSSKVVTPLTDYYQQKLGLSCYYVGSTIGYTETQSTTATLTVQLYNNVSDGNYNMYPYSQAYGTAFTQTINISYSKHIPAYYVKLYYNSANTSSMSCRFTTDSGNYLSGTSLSFDTTISNTFFTVVKGPGIKSVTASATASSSKVNGYYYRNKAYYRYRVYYNIGNGTDYNLCNSDYSWYPYSLDTYDFTSNVKNISGVNFSMDSSKGLNLGVKLEFTEIAAPEVVSRTDAGDWKRHLTLKNPNPITFGIYYTSNKNKSSGSINSSSTWSNYGVLGPSGVSNTITISDQGGYDDKWITFGVQCGNYGLSSGYNYYHCRTITEDPKTSTSDVAVFWMTRKV